MTHQNKKNDEGAATPAIAVGLVATVVLVIIISLAGYILKNQHDTNSQQLHDYQEKAAYRYAEKKNQANEMKRICDSNARTFETLKTWLSQKRLQPPPEYISDIPCAVNTTEEK